MSENTIAIGPNVGELAAGVIQSTPEPQRRLKTATCRLVGVFTDGVQPGTITLPAHRRQYGMILVGPKAEFVGEKNRNSLVRALRAYRWTLNPIRISAGGHVTGYCSITPTNRIRLVCRKCKHEMYMWANHVYHILNAHRYREPSEDATATKPSVYCPVCAGAGQQAEMTRYRMFNSTVPRDATHLDPVLSSLDDPKLDTLMDTWTRSDKSPEADESLLPRVWAVYPHGKTPIDWVPEDSLAHNVNKKLLELRHAEICPFAAASNSEFKGVKGFLLEAYPTFRVGWVNEDDLRDTETYGYRRVFVEQSPAGKYVI